MNWLEAFFAWLFRLPRVPALAALARTYLNAVLHDLEHHPQGSLDPETEQSLRRNCGGLVMTAHTLVAAYVISRAREIAGLHVTRPHWDFAANPRRLPTRASLARRAAELLRRLDRAEVHARRLAAKLTTSELAGLTGTLSTRIPDEDGGPDSRASANSNRQKTSALRAPAGCPPARATRLMGFAIRDGPVLAA